MSNFVYFNIFGKKKTIIIAEIPKNNLIKSKQNMSSL